MDVQVMRLLKHCASAAVAREHKKMKMEMEDLKNRMRDIINMKVTREIQAVSEALKSDNFSRRFSCIYPSVI